jgi:3-oxoacyl-[acyl-carrier protein] reductase
MREFRGKKALITGAASGIGRAITLELAKRGTDVWLLDIDDANLAAVAEEARRCGVEAVCRRCDLTSSAEIGSAVEAVGARWGRLNILINNAGIAARCPLHEMSDVDWHRIMAINLLAPIALTRALMPLLLVNEAHVLNVCSIFGLVTTRKAAAYQTSKFGLVGFTHALRAEYGSPQFGITALCPGFVDTPLMARIAATQPDRVPPSWTHTTPEVVAAAAITAIRRNKGIVVITALARFNWIGARVFPRLPDFLYRRPWRYWLARRRDEPGQSPAAEAPARERYTHSS